MPPHPLTGGPFTARQALAAGMTRDQLRSARFRPVFRGVWVPSELPDSCELRLAAASLVIPPGGVLRGTTAAWLHGVDVRRRDDLDVHVGFPRGRRTRSRPGLVVCQETLDAADVQLVGGIAVTTPVRTVFDCLRWLPRVEGLIVADALCHAGCVTVPEIAAYFAGQHRLRNLRRGGVLVELIEPGAESPMETRTRLVLIDYGLPRPRAQVNVFDAAAQFIGRLDLAYEQARLGVEFDGALHWEQRQADDRRRQRIRAQGWEVLVFHAHDIFGRPEQTARLVADLLRARR